MISVTLGTSEIAFLKAVLFQTSGITKSSLGLDCGVCWKALLLSQERRFAKPSTRVAYKLSS